MFKKKGIAKRQEKAENNAYSIGNILVTASVITPEQLDIALKKQREERDERVGQILVEDGYISLEILEYYIQKQQVLRNKFRSRDMRVYLETAQRRSQSALEAHGELAQAALSLATKLKG